MNITPFFLKLPDITQTDLNDTQAVLYREYFLELGNVE